MEEYDPPILSFCRDEVPPRLRCIDPPASKEELAHADGVRSRYFLPDGPGAYMTDIVRGFRIARSASTYIEVGTRDKGNVAWVSSLLAPCALIIDVDIAQLAGAANRLAAELPAGMSYRPIEGDSVARSTYNRVLAALGEKRADVVFLDSSHMFDHAIREFNLYFSLLRPGGVLMIHDIFWEGNETDRGKSQAAALIDQRFPVYVVYMNEPVRRFHPLSAKKDAWGGLGIIEKPA